MSGIELSILRFFEAMRTDGLNLLFETITMLGEETLLVLLISILWFAFDKKFAQRVFFITMTSLGLNGTIKNIAKIPRPWTTGEVSCVRPETATGYSFPSGHTQSFTTWSSALAVYLKKNWFSCITAILIVLVGISRIYLGAHYPSDVLVAIALGTGFAFAGNKIFDKVENKQKLYLGSMAVFAPFAILFLFRADPLYEDFYKFYGMLAGLPLAVFIEEKYAPITYDTAAWKKAVRVVVGVLLALVVKESLKVLYVFESVPALLLVDAVRYFALIVVVLGLWPVVFKKCNL